MSGAAAMIAEAKKHNGVGEPNAFQAWYRDRNGGAYAGNFAWCDAFVTYCSYHSGNYEAVNHGTDYAYTVAHAQRFQKAGEWHAGTKGNVAAAHPGDIVFFDWGGSDSIGNIDHVGIVIKAHSNGTVDTIEGNASDRVGLHTRSYADIAGYGRPKYVGARGEAPTPEAPAKPADPMSDGVLKVGEQGAAVKSLQQHLNTLGAAPKLDADGDFGPKTETAVRSFQSHHGLTADGEAGPKTLAAVTAALPRAEPGPVKPVPVPAPKPVVEKPAPVKPVAQKPAKLPKLAVDGAFGPKTVKALQAALSVSQDGKWGTVTKKALQKHLKVTADGVIGPVTVRALQHKVGTKQDGKWGSATTRALQKALNGGKF